MTWTQWHERELYHCIIAYFQTSENSQLGANMKTDVFLGLLLENFQSLCKQDYDEGKLTYGEYDISMTRVLKRRME